MAVSDPVGDLLTRIRNAQTRRRPTTNAPASKLRRWVLDVLKKEGYIRGYEIVKNDRGHKEIRISLKYHDGRPVIRELKRISRPGRRVYAGVRKVPIVRQGLGVAIVSTARGVMSDAEAREANVGGEILCTVF
ncbi:MAG: 30S ribosomal protein S8 [Rhodobacteraceae bacterium]|nr:30S ribosomal protein S8 [Paracoccaceae bacterium]MCY4195741.1 30S ribosomal protein S8 [Paracoccaceae bacterium]MCY4327873.1 30S ribosomal protein S8 [Paracoccaceae bacterium]